MGEQLTANILVESKTEDFLAPSFRFLYNEVILSERTDLSMKLGSHVSMSGKEMLLGSAKEAVSYGADTFIPVLRRIPAEKTSANFRLILPGNT